jgi:hypothetical protein
MRRTNLKLTTLRFTWGGLRRTAIAPVTVILAAAQRRYPEMTREELEENLDIPTLKQLWQELWAMSFLNSQADRGPKQ